MTDKMTPEQRSRCMSRIRGKNTRPEMIVRKYLFSRGLRFRIHVRKLPGTPDIVLRKYRTAIFINGCFWHGHSECGAFHLPENNRSFWEQKINLNIARDYRWNVELKLLGWRVLTVWECELAPKKREATLNSLYESIVAPTLPVRRAAAKPVRRYLEPDDEPQTDYAAEDEENY